MIIKEVKIMVKNNYKLINANNSVIYYTDVPLKVKGSSERDHQIISCINEY